MTLQELVDASRRIAATSSRSEKTRILADAIQRLAPDEIEVGAGFLSGRTTQGRLGLGWATIDAARRVSASGVSTVTTPGADRPLELRDVDDALKRIAGISGSGSTGARTSALADLFRKTSPEEADFLARVIVGEVRQGALEGIMEEAIAKASGIPVSEIRRAIMMSGDIIPVARAALGDGRAGLSGFQLQIFRPVRPMLAQTAADLTEALERIPVAALEYKLDGARIQVHKSGSQVQVFSRLLNNVTSAVPEVVEIVRRLPANQLILDGEVLALKPDGSPHPFQVTMKRFGRKLDVERLRGEFPLSPYFFDVLKVDDRDFIGTSARERFQALRDQAGAFAVPQRWTGDVTEAEAFLDEALAHGHEGIMVKSLDSPYEAGSRGFSWLKLKPTHTLDLVVLAAEWGHGRRQGRLSNIHLGARDPATGSFAMVGKTFKGMTDELLAWQTRRFQEIALSTDGFTVHLRPEIMVEVAFNDVQESPRYASGMALRFARVKRYRDDKTPDEADTLETIRALLVGDIRKKSRPPVSR